MKKKLLFAFVYVMFITFAHAQQDIPVFISGTEGYESYRIPAMITLPDGDLLAFCEGRKHGISDFGDIDIVLKKSKDKGKTWGEMQLVVNYDSLQAGNAAPVVDLTDPAYPKGRIFLFYNTGNNQEGEVRKGNGLREVWYVTSTDGGQTWSAPQNITSQVHKPNQPNKNPAYHYTEDWRSYANTPGHAMQFAWGKYKGRIFVSANHSAGNPQAAFKDYKAHGYYTDDHGKTFHLSEDVPFAGGNEAMAAQLSGDKLMMNIRNQQGNVKARIIAISSNGGSTWDTAYYDYHLPDPVSQGSILSFKNKQGKTVLAVCNAADTSKRDNLILRLSNNDGKSWYKNMTVAKSGADYKGSSFSAYSDITKTNDKTIGVLFEKDNYKEIVFTTVTWQ
jgi:sialidase-1